MSSASSLITRIFSGSLSTRAQGFMIIPPKGYKLQSTVESTLLQVYGSAQHPDVRRLAPGGAGNLIKVDDVRDIQGFLASTPSGPEMKTLMVYQADRMNENAANALLKPLEEPSRHTRIVLITDDPSRLPSTIRSRCSVHTLAQEADLAKAEMQDRAHELDFAINDADVGKAIDLGDQNPHLAVEIHRFKLAAWIKKIETWLASSDPTPPLPQLAGKSGVPLPIVFMTLQSLFARMSRQEVSIKGWTTQRSLDATWKIIEKSIDIDRAGIDAKTRLHTALIGARSS